MKWEILGTKLEALDGLDLGAFNDIELGSLEGQTDGTTEENFYGLLLGA